MYIDMVQFEWDEAKRESNLRRHGVDFQDAWMVFENPYFEWPDQRRDYREERFAILGAVAGVVVNLIYTRREERVRIISFRKANKRERRRYEEEISDRLGTAAHHDR